MAKLIVLSGLPGVGKTTFARALAAETGAVLIRIDSIEQALRAKPGQDIGPAGYLIGYGVARDHLRKGRTVVADSVNPVPESRDGWRRAARDAEADIQEIELVCSNKKEHKRRVETRVPDIEGLVPPRWKDVRKRDYRAWTDDVARIDTASAAPDALVAAFLATSRTSAGA